MAVDKLVDSTQLDSDLTSVANAIRTKGGTSAQLAFPSGFVSAIGDIPTGGGVFNVMKYAVRPYRIFYFKQLPEKVVLDFENNEILYSISGAQSNEMFYGVSGIEELELKNGKINAICNSMFNTTSLKKITFTNFVFAPYGNASYMFSACTYLTDIIGEIDLSDATDVTGFFSSDISLKEVRFKENSINVSVSWNTNLASISDDSLVSIGNALNPNVTGKTFKFYSTILTKINSIMGTNDNGTFVADAQGTLSLADFITNVKGWTLT